MRRMNRYEFTVTLIRLQVLLQPVGTPAHPDNAFYLPEAIRSGKQEELDTARSDLQQKLENSSQAAGALAALVQEFHPELVLLRVDVHGLQKSIEPLQALADASQEGKPRISGPVEILRRSSASGRPFPDVPKDHWAYQAVETVRKAGIVIGYPDNRFRAN